MEELTLKDYPLGVLRNILGTSDKQGTDRKLEKYGYGFTSTGRGNTRVYTITSLPDAFHRFRSYCVFNLGYSPKVDFVKLRDFLYLLLGDEDFNWLPDEAKEAYTRLMGKGISRQTIAKYTRELEKTGFIDTIFGDFVYYRVYKDCGVQKHEIITKEEYSKAWKLYWDWRNAHPDKDSTPAYAHMYSKFGGVPRKQRKVQPIIWYKSDLDYILELAAASILEEVSD